MTEALAGNRVPTSESLDVIRKIAGIDVKRTNTPFHGDRGASAVVLKGFARHKNELTGALCS